MTFRERMKRLQVLEAGAAVMVESAWIVSIEGEPVHYVINGAEVTEDEWTRAGLHRIPVKCYVDFDPSSV